MVKLEGVFVTEKKNGCNETQETEFFQTEKYVFFVGKGKDNKGRDFKNHGYAELPKDGITQDCSLIFSWGDSYDSNGTELTYPHKMTVSIRGIDGNQVTKIEKIEDVRILRARSKRENITKDKNIGNWVFVRI